MIPHELRFYGDSITAGTGASVPYPAIIASRLGAVLSNDAMPSAQLIDVIERRIYRREVRAEASILLVGYNDMRHLGSVAASQLMYAAELEAAIAWLAIPESAKWRAQDVIADGWTANPYIYGGGMGIYSRTVGATVKATVSGSTVYVGATLQYSPTKMATFTVSVDGVVAGTYSSNTVSDFTSVSGIGYAPFLVRVGGLADGPHEVAVQVASADNGGAAYVDWFAAVPAVAQPVFVGNCLRMNPAGYALGGQWMNGSDTVVQQFNALTAGAVANLEADGLPVRLVDAAAVYNLATDVSADNVHPNDYGHARIAAAFLSQMRRA